MKKQALPENDSEGSKSMSMTEMKETNQESKPPTRASSDELYNIHWKLSALGFLITNQTNVMVMESDQLAGLGLLVGELAERLKPLASRVERLEMGMEKAERD
jgi:hypothetical protein